MNFYLYTKLIMLQINMYQIAWPTWAVLKAFQIIKCFWANSYFSFELFLVLLHRINFNLKSILFPHSEQKFVFEEGKISSELKITLTLLISHLQI